MIDCESRLGLSALAMCFNIKAGRGRLAATFTNALKGALGIGVGD